MAAIHQRELGLLRHEHEGEWHARLVGTVGEFGKQQIEAAKTLPPRGGEGRPQEVRLIPVVPVEMR